jgi:hypothetical protein
LILSNKLISLSACRRKKRDTCHQEWEAKDQSWLVLGKTFWAEVNSDPEVSIKWGRLLEALRIDK